MTLRRIVLGSAAVLATAGCADDVLAPAGPVTAQFANGPKGAVTVTSLDDPGDGVCTADHCTLREAIGKAQAGERIVFKSTLSGTIELTAGELVIDKPLRIEGEGRITVDAQQASRVMSVEAAVVLDGLHLTRGAASDGGGISAQADVTLINSAVTESSATGFGGGIMFYGGALTIRGSHVDRNTSGGPGGGLYISDGSLSMDRSTVNANHAGVSPTGANGGGIFNWRGMVEIVGSAVMDNEAVWVSGSVFGNGGGIYNRAEGELVLVATTIARNTAGGGGGIYSNGSLALVRSTVSNNLASTVPGGGGISATGGFVSVRSTSIIANAGVAGTGMGIHASGSLTRLTLANTIVAGHVFLGTFSSDCLVANGAVISSLGYNLSTSCVGAATDVVVSAAQVFTEVVDAELKDNGGSVLTHALIERGRAVDSGYCPGETTDQRGFARPFDDARVSNGRDGCDIGAFEWQPTQSPPRNSGRGPRK